MVYFWFQFLLTLFWVLYCCAFSTLQAAARLRTDSIASAASSQTLFPGEDDREDSFGIRRASSDIRRFRSSHDGNTALHVACTKDDSAVIWALSTYSLDEIDTRNYRQQTPLMLACQQGLGVTAITALITAGANTAAQDVHCTSVLHYACEGGNIDVVNLLLTTYNVDIKGNLRGQSPIDMTEKNDIKTLVKQHKDDRDRKRQEALADAAYVELGEEDIADMPIPSLTEAEEEGYAVI